MVMAHCEEDLSPAMSRLALPSMASSSLLYFKVQPGRFARDVVFLLNLLKTDALRCLKDYILDAERVCLQLVEGT